jgi:hypothetical protein
LKHSKILICQRIMGDAFSTTPSHSVHQPQDIQIYITTFKSLSGRHAILSFRLALLGQFNAPGQSFVPKGSQCLSSDRIHQAAFALRCFANRGPRDCLLSGIITCSQWPIPRGSVRPQSRVGTMRRVMLTKLQSLFCLPKMEL